MSFEEFSAIRRRRKLPPSALESEEPMEHQVDSVLARLGSLMQSQEVQLVVVLVIALDICSGMYQMYAEAKEWSSPFLIILKYQSGISMLFFIFELLLVLVSFGTGTFSHFGYSLDIALVSVMLYDSTINDCLSGMRILGIFRLWRVGRMVNIYIKESEKNFQETKQLVVELENKLDALKLRATKAELGQKREAERYKRLEQSYRAQKDEVSLFCLPEATKLNFMIA